MKQTNNDRNGKNMKIALLITYTILIVAMTAQTSQSMGVGPSSQQITFSPGQEIRGEIIIVNNEGRAFKAGVYPQGSMSDIVTVEKPLVDVSEDDTMVAVPYKLKFPATAPKPGEHTIELVIRQFPPDAQVDEGTIISATMAYISKIIIKVPYPGKFAEGKLYISNTEDMNTPSRFAITLFNFGTENIEKAYADIAIMGPSFEKVASFSTDTASIKSKEEGKLEALWTPKVPKGSYKAVAKIHYDEKEITIEQPFDLGRFLIDVSDISVKKFTLGDVAKFDIALFNSWNTEIKDVFVEMVVEDSSGKEMTRFKTTVIDIPSQQAGLLEAYWYTEGAAPGIYKVKLLVQYAGKLTQREYDFEVSTNSITKLGEGIVGQAVSAQDQKEMSTQGLIILLILIVLVLIIGMNFVWFYVLTKKLKGGQQ